MTRWVAPRSGVAETLYLRVKVEGADCRAGGRAGYAAGTSGRLVATTHPVRPDGRPDTRTTLAEAQLVVVRLLDQHLFDDEERPGPRP